MHSLTLMIELKKGAVAKWMKESSMEQRLRFYAQNKNGEVLIVTLRRKPNRFEHKNAWLDLLYYFMQFCCVYTLKCVFQSAGRFIAVRLTTPILF